jgi:hypothetical protein
MTISLEKTVELKSNGEKYVIYRILTDTFKFQGRTVPMSREELINLYRVLSYFIKEEGGDA